jgi:ComF family protein
MEQRTGLCQACIDLVQPITSKRIQVTKKYSMTVLALGAYANPLRPLILAKIRSDIVAAQQLGKLIERIQYIKHHSFDYIVPIPLHWTRYAARGFNQAEEMAHEIERYNGATVACILRRIKRTKFQYLLTSAQRDHNVLHVIALKNIDYKLYQNKHILLVDDLMTTGSTLKTAAQALITLRPASITAVVAGRVI